MSQSSILGGSSAAARSSGKDVDALGPSDTSDTGSDVQGERSMSTGADSPDEWGAVVTETDNDSDSSGTGERSSAGGDAPDRDSADILPDRIVDDGIDPETMLDMADVADLPDDADDGDADAEDESSADEPGATTAGSDRSPRSPGAR